MEELFQQELLEQLFQQELLRQLPKKCYSIIIVRTVVPIIIIRTGILKIIVLTPLLAAFCQTSDLGLRLEVDFVFPLSEEEQEQEQPPPKSKLKVWNLAHRPKQKRLWSKVSKNFGPKKLPENSGSKKIFVKKTVSVHEKLWSKKRLCHKILGPTKILKPK